MMDFFPTLFGTEHALSPAQECARAVLIFFYGLVLLRLSGRRTFGHWSAVDVILSIIVGSCLSRALTGSAPLAGTMAAAAVLVGLHAGTGWLLARRPELARLVEGRAITLIREGKIDQEARKSAKISEPDLEEALRRHGIETSDHVQDVKLMMLEPSGKFSLIRKNS